MTEAVIPRCSRCGARLRPRDTEREACPGCLLELGLEGGADRPHALLQGHDAANHPERIGRYRIVELIGEGGMGRVYLAEETEPIRRAVALKLVKLGMDSREIVARFESERQALALMNHPNVARVHDAGLADDGRPYFVIEYVPGPTITEHCDRERLNVRDRVALFLQACDGLQHAHQKGIIHRDVKPSNVLVATDSGRATVKVIDFGVAKATDPLYSDALLQTHEGTVLGTLAYMSPEQARATDGDVDTRADVYSLGVLLYELLTGAPPFDPDALRRMSDVEMLRVIREVEPPRPASRLAGFEDVGARVARLRRTEPSSLMRQLRGELAWIIARAMEKDPARRYATVSEMSADLRRFLDHEPVLARPQSAIYRLRKLVRRNKAAVVATLAIVLASLVFGIASAMQAERTARESAVKSQVTEFLVELFRVADSGQTRGEQVSARELLDVGAKRIEATLASDPSVRAELMAAMGRAYHGLGLFASAEPLLEEAVTLYGKEWGQEHADTLTARSLLATLRFDQGRYRESEALNADVAELRARVLGPDHPDTLAARTRLAIDHHRQGNYAQAESMLRDNLDALRRVVGPDHVETVAALSALGNACSMQRRHAEAEVLHREVLEIRKRVLGPDHPDTLATMSNLGFILHSQGRDALAGELLYETLETARRVHGPDHSFTLKVVGNLARAYNAQKRHAEAEALHREALATLTRTLGRDHPRTLWSIDGVAYACAAQGRHAEAAALHREMLETMTHTLGPEHTDTLGAMNSLALDYSAGGDLASAEALFREAIDVGSRAFGADHSLTVLCRKNLADVLAKQGRLADAELHFREAIAARTRVLGPEHRDTLFWMPHLAALEAAIYGCERALATLREAVTLGYPWPDLLTGDLALTSRCGGAAFDELVAAAKENASRPTVPPRRSAAR